MLLESPNERLVEEYLTNKKFKAEDTAETLHFAEQQLQPYDFKMLKAFVHQGFFEAIKSLDPEQDQHTVQILYNRWCHAFNRPWIALWGEGTIRIAWPTKNLRPHQVKALEALGWVIGSDRVSLSRDKYLHPEVSDFNALRDPIQWALAVLGSTFRLLC